MDKETFIALQERQGTPRHVAEAQWALRQRFVPQTQPSGTPINPAAPKPAPNLSMLSALAGPSSEVPAAIKAPASTPGWSPGQQEQRQIIDLEKGPVAPAAPVNITGGQGGAINNVANWFAGLGPAAAGAGRDIEATFRDIFGGPNKALFGTRPVQPAGGAEPAQPATPSMPAPTPPAAPAPAPSVARSGGGGGGGAAPSEPWVSPERYVPKTVSMNPELQAAMEALRTRYADLQAALMPEDQGRGFMGLLRRAAPGLIAYAQSGNVGDLGGGIMAANDSRRAQQIEALKMSLMDPQLQMQMAREQQGLDVQNTNLENEANRFNLGTSYEDRVEKAEFGANERRHADNVSLGRAQINASTAAQAAQNKRADEQRQLMLQLALGGPAGIRAMAETAYGPGTQQAANAVKTRVANSVMMAAADGRGRQTLNRMLQNAGIKIKNERDTASIMAATEYFFQNPSALEAATAVGGLQLQMPAMGN